MSLRTMRGLLALSSLALGLTAVGCGDDDNKPGDMMEMDGGSDSGRPDGGGGDARVDAGGDGNEMACGELTCTGTMLVTTAVRPCCVSEEMGGGCGLLADDIGMITMQDSFKGCIPKDVMAASASTHCGAFLDQVEPDVANGDNDALHSNEGLDISSPLGALTFGGCCLPSGECGALLSSPVAPPAFSSLNLHFGCVSISQLMALLPSSDEGPSRPAPTLLPFCNPTGGDLACPGKMTALLCDRFSALIPNCDPTADTPDWVCQALNLPKASDGMVPSVECMAGIPSFVRGCGAPTGENCVPNIPADVFGCNDVPAGKNVPNVPVFVCGCGVGQSGASCIPNVAPDVCGAVPASDANLGLAPKFACGCGENTLDTNPNDFPPCLPNVAPETCGAADPSEAVLSRVPEFICGCVDDPFGRANCMRNVPVATCGTLETQIGTRAELGGAKCLVGLPEYAVGCGNEAGPSQANPTCLRNAGDPAAPAENIFGCVDVTTPPPLPEYLCGCGPTNPYQGAGDGDGPLPCLSFVDKNICGAVQVPNASASLLPLMAQLPRTFCGCGDGQLNTVTQSLPCIPNVALDVCAPAPAPIVGGCVQGYPNVVQGCGETTPAPSYPIQCISNVPVGTVGCTVVNPPG